MMIFDALVGWVAISVVLLVLGVSFGPFVVCRDKQIGHGTGLDRCRNSNGDLPFQGIRPLLGIGLFVLPPTLSGIHQHGTSGAIIGLLLGGGFLLWLAAVKWWTVL